jgi:hypothetical protein
MPYEQAMHPPQFLELLNQKSTVLNLWGLQMFFRVDGVIGQPLALALALRYSRSTPTRMIVDRPL